MEQEDHFTSRRVFLLQLQLTQTQDDFESALLERLYSQGFKLPQYLLPLEHGVFGWVKEKGTLEVNKTLKTLLKSN